MILLYRGHHFKHFAKIIIKIGPAVQTICAKNDSPLGAHRPYPLRPMRNTGVMTICVAVVKNGIILLENCVSLIYE